MVQKNIKLLNYFKFFTNFSFYAPIAIIYFQHVTHSYALAASILSVSLVTSALLDVPTGIYADIKGRKNTMVLGALASVLAVIFYALGGGVYWVLVLGAILDGASRAFYSGNNYAFLHNLLASEGLEDQYHHYSGRLEAILIVGTSIASLLSGFIASWSFALLIWLSVIPQVICLFITLNLSETADYTKTGTVLSHMKEALSAIIHRPTLRLLSISDILGNSVGPTAFQFQSAVYNAFWPLWAVGIGRAIAEWIAAPTSYFSGKIIDKLGGLKVMLISDVYAWLANVVAVVFPSVVSPLIISTSPVLWGPGDVAKRSLLQKEFTERQRATIASINSFIGSCLFAGLAYFVGLFADAHGPIKALLLVQVIAIPGLLVSFRLYSKHRRST